MELRDSSEQPDLSEAPEPQVELERQEKPD